MDTSSIWRTRCSTSKTINEFIFSNTSQCLQGLAFLFSVTYEKVSLSKHATGHFFTQRRKVLRCNALCLGVYLFAPWRGKMPSNVLSKSTHSCVCHCQYMLGLCLNQNTEGSHFFPFHKYAVNPSKSLSEFSVLALCGRILVQPPEKIFCYLTEIPYLCTANGNSRMYSGPRSADNDKESRNESGSPYFLRSTNPVLSFKDGYTVKFVHLAVDHNQNQFD